MSPDEIAKKSAEALWKGDHATAAAGMQLISVAPGEAIISMRVRKDMTNGHGTCHGGYLFLLADSAFAFACNSYNQRAVAQHCTITYIAPAREGMLLFAEGKERQRAERSGIYDVSVRTEAGEIIAEFRGNNRTIAGSLF